MAIRSARQRRAVMAKLRGHTPGPWHILMRSSRIGGGDAKRTIAGESRPGAFGGQVATVGWEDLSEETTEANARIIAAAPALLSALKELRQEAVSMNADLRRIGRGRPEDGSHPDSPIESARVAIAEAEEERR